MSPRTQRPPSAPVRPSGINAASHLMHGHGIDYARCWPGRCWRASSVSATTTTSCLTHELRMPRPATSATTSRTSSLTSASKRWWASWRLRSASCVRLPRPDRRSVVTHGVASAGGRFTLVGCPTHCERLCAHMKVHCTPPMMTLRQGCSIPGCRHPACAPTRTLIRTTIRLSSSLDASDLYCGHPIRPQRSAPTRGSTRCGTRAESSSKSRTSRAHAPAIAPAPPSLSMWLQEMSSTSRPSGEKLEEYNQHELQPASNQTNKHQQCRASMWP
mmetsp:Transcript_20000/g.40703  ORF Transcript_20000/g.40703 Transcript_20000/m.40703 type:complete len:273 (+) Transcript_20000:91-909(+)